MIRKSLSLLLGVLLCAYSITAVPHVADGHFDYPLKGYWYFNQLGARPARVKYRGNYALRIGHINCENEEYAIAFGQMVGTVASRTYTLSFDYLFTEKTKHVDWIVDYFRSKFCSPCEVFEFSNIHFTRSVKANRWYKWRGDFVKDPAFSRENLTVSVEASTCAYLGTTLLDNFVIKQK